MGARKRIRANQIKEAKKEKAFAILRGCPSSPQKMRLVADLVRGKDVQRALDIDAAGNGSYTWTKYNKDGVVDTSWGTNGSKTGKTLSVSSADVDTKATFMVVVAL